jgi:hypothetical protein
MNPSSMYSVGIDMIRRISAIRGAWTWVKNTVCRGDLEKIHKSHSHRRKSHVVDMNESMNIINVPINCDDRMMDNDANDTPIVHKRSEHTHTRLCTRAKTRRWDEAWSDEWCDRSIDWLCKHNINRSDMVWMSRDEHDTSCNNMHSPRATVSDRVRNEINTCDTRGSMKLKKSRCVANRLRRITLRKLIEITWNTYQSIHHTKTSAHAKNSDQFAGFVEIQRFKVSQSATWCAVFKSIDLDDENELWLAIHNQRRTSMHNKLEKPLATYHALISTRSCSRLHTSN